MVRNRDEAVVVMNKQTRNKVGTCQMVTRGWYDAPSAGDRDGDGDADANDGWLSEPPKFRHLGDRNPPKGVPLYFRNLPGKPAKTAYGHRAATRSTGGNCRSTDMSNGRYAAGVTGNATIAQIEKSMGLHYVGWSETITGQLIPLGPSSKPSKPSTGSTADPKRVPASWSGFVHLDPKKFMNYLAAIEEAAKTGKGVDIDVHFSKDGTAWAAHWATVAANHAHDPLKKIAGSRRLSSLTDKELDRLRGPNGQKAFRRVNVLLREAAKLGVRVELEVKVKGTLAQVRRVMRNTWAKKLHVRHLLQVKTLAAMNGSLQRLAPWQAEGAVTILSFTKYKGKGISKKAAGPVVDYYRGTPKWVA